MSRYGNIIVLVLVGALLGGAVLHVLSRLYTHVVDDVSFPLVTDFFQCISWCMAKSEHCITAGPTDDFCVVSNDESQFSCAQYCVANLWAGIDVYGFLRAVIPHWEFVYAGTTFTLLWDLFTVLVFFLAANALSILFGGWWFGMCVVFSFLTYAAPINHACLVVVPAVVAFVTYRNNHFDEALASWGLATVLLTHRFGDGDAFAYTLAVAGYLVHLGGFVLLLVSLVTRLRGTKPGAILSGILYLWCVYSGIWMYASNAFLVFLVTAVFASLIASSRLKQDVFQVDYTLTKSTSDPMDTDRMRKSTFIVCESVPSALYKTVVTQIVHWPLSWIHMVGVLSGKAPAVRGLHLESATRNPCVDPLQVRYVGKIMRGEKFEGTIFRTSFGWFTATHNCFKPISAACRGPVEGLSVEYNGKRYKMVVQKWYDDVLLVDLQTDAVNMPSLANWPKLQVGVYKPELHPSNACTVGYYDDNGTPVALANPGKIIELDGAKMGKHTCWTDYGMSGSPVVYGFAGHVAGVHIQGGKKDANGIAPWNVFKPFTEELKSAFGDSRVVGEITLSAPAPAPAGDVETPTATSSWYRGYEEPYIEEDDMDRMANRLDDLAEKYGHTERFREAIKQYADLEDDYYNQYMNNQERMEFEQRAAEFDQVLDDMFGDDRWGGSDESPQKLPHKALLAHNMFMLRYFKEILGIPHVDVNAGKPKKPVPPLKPSTDGRRKIPLKDVVWSDLVAHPGQKKLLPTKQPVKREVTFAPSQKKGKSPDPVATAKKQGTTEKSKPRVPNTEPVQESSPEPPKASKVTKREVLKTTAELVDNVTLDQTNQVADTLKAQQQTIEKLIGLMKEVVESKQLESAAPKQEKKAKPSTPLKLAKKKLVQAVKSGKDHSKARDGYIKAVVKRQEELAEKKADKIESSKALETAQKQADTVIQKLRPKSEASQPAEPGKAK